MAEGDTKLTVIGLVLARGGSEGIKKKNARVVCGSPLLAWVLKPMRHCKNLDEIWVSTDDQDLEDIAYAEDCAVFRRSEEFAQGDSPSVLAVQEFLREKTNADVIALVQCSSPCLLPSYLDEAVSLVTSGKYDSVFSVTRDYKWRWTELSEEDGTTRPLNFDPAQRLCRQQWAGEIVESGHFYVSRVEFVQEGLLQGGRCGFVELPRHLCHEVDSEEDVVVAEQRLHKYGFRGDIVLAAPTEFQ